MALFLRSYTSSADLESLSLSAGINSYGGGGYIMHLTGFISEVEERLQLLRDNAWIDNRTRGLIVELGVYNAQVCSI